MKMEDYKKSLTEMSEEELREEIFKIRNHRRTVPQTNVIKKQKQSVTKKIGGLSKEAAMKLLADLEDM